jgi:hypothetical protein
MRRSTEARPRSSQGGRETANPDQQPSGRLTVPLCQAVASTAGGGGSACARDRLALAPRRRRARRGCPPGFSALRPLTTGIDVPSVAAVREQVLDARGRRLRARKNDAARMRLMRDWLDWWSIGSDTEHGLRLIGQTSNRNSA